MNDYIKVDFTLEPVNETEADILDALLCEIGFESFESTETGVWAYIKKELFQKDLIHEAVSQYDFTSKITWNDEFIEGRDWNEEWEKNFFKPMVIANRCVIHSTFHTNVPKARYDILIDPKMAFGTGYHQTTCHMLRAILASDMSGKSVLDMGCGTALLAILARKHGAEKVVAIDIDEFAYENAKENVALNGTPDIEVRLGGADAIKESDSFDYVIANINRNILLMDMVNYVRCMHTGSQIFISGFYTEDMEVLKEEAARHGLRYLDYAENDNWAMMKFVKE